MKPNIKITPHHSNIVLITHISEPQFQVEYDTTLNEIDFLKVFSNGYLTKELNVILEEAKTFIKSLKFA